MDDSYSFPNDTTRFKDFDRIAQVSCSNVTHQAYFFYKQ
jgi:hypothetical protein